MNEPGNYFPNLKDINYLLILLIAILSIAFIFDFDYIGALDQTRVAHLVVRHLRGLKNF